MEGMFMYGLLMPPIILSQYRGFLTYLLISLIYCLSSSSVISLLSLLLYIEIFNKWKKAMMANDFKCQNIYDQGVGSVGIVYGAFTSMCSSGCKNFECWY